MSIARLILIFLLMYTKCLNPLIMVREPYLLSHWSRGVKNIKEHKKKLTSFINVRSLYKALGNVGAKEYIRDLFDRYNSDEFGKNFGSKFTVVPCRKCFNCQRIKALHWSIRNSIVSQDYDKKVFLTLTINDEFLIKKFLNDNGYADILYAPFQSFLKRLRKEFSHLRLKFYMCGEYGSKGDRPHYHCIIYGLGIDDLKCFYHSKNGYGQTVYRSDILEKLWTYGFSTVGEVSDFSIMYVARYCTKKTLNTEWYYKYIRTPEYNHMSQGFGKNYIIDNLDDIYKNDKFMIKLGDRVYEMQPLDYMDKQYEKEHGSFELSKIKFNRQKIKEDAGIKPYDSVMYEFKTDLNYEQYLSQLEQLYIKNNIREEII